MLFAMVAIMCITGILLVIILLTLNMTASKNAIIPDSKHFFPAFISWLNLNIGFDVCFLDGLDTYTKTWLQLAFPVYIISLIVIVIKTSDHSSRFTRLIGPRKRDPVATLATLTLLSYTKLLSTTIAILSFAILQYPDGTRHVVWLPDGNIQFMKGKHIALVVTALLIIAIGVPYTLLLFLWQWLIRIPNGKLFLWTKNTKLNAVITTYHTPYIYKHRYWTGLLLTVRVVLYITATVTMSGNPQVPLLMTIILVGGLLFLKGVIGRLHRKISMDIVETVILLNIMLILQNKLQLHISPQYSYLCWEGSLIT